MAPALGLAPVSADDSIELLSRALAQLSTLMAGTTPEQRGWPTPCAGWDVSTLVDHLHSDVSRFIVAARGEQPDWRSPEAHIREDWVAEFSAVVGRALEFGGALLRPESRGPEGSGKVFGLEVPVSDDAPLDDRLAGWFGRRPDWGRTR